MTRRTVIADVPPNERSVAPYKVMTEGGGADPRPVFFASHPAAARYAALKAGGGPVVDRTSSPHLFPKFAAE
ncbi:MAG TPA: hypothetical protein VGC15_20385 [Acetobacteraceae bacterium]